MAQPIIRHKIDKSNVSIAVFENNHGYNISVSDWYKKKDGTEVANKISLFPNQARALGEQLIATCDQLHDIAEQNKAKTAQQQEEMPYIVDEDDDIPFG